MKAITLNTKTAINEFNPSQLIAKKESLVKEIRAYWGIINSNNVIEKGVKQKYDLQRTYTELNRMENDLIEIKLAIQAINMGLSKMSELSENNLYSQIYLMQQLKEHKVKLGMIPTKKSDNETVVLTANFIKNEMESIDKSVQEIQTYIDNFNSKTKFKFSE